MQQLTRDTIETLEGMQVALTYEEAIELEVLACKLKNRGLDADPAILTMSYHTIAGLKIYPLTLGAKLWLRRVYDLFDDDMITTVAMIFALEHSLEADTFVYGKDEINLLLSKYGKKLKITDSDLKELEEHLNKGNVNAIEDISYLLQDLVKQIQIDAKNLNLVGVNKYFDENQSDKNNIKDQIATISVLMHCMGESRAFWLWECSEEYLEESINTAESILSQGGNKQSGKSREWAKDFIKFNAFVNKLKERANG